ncbi:hypothetical protein C3L50_00750 [Flavobacterium alvei]|uniref:LVIVD repeat-containing protein n=1 Tax=Flavobacterium alvei TaxID=2080416 RepID=A0A2S5AFL8_9FLAO|nr:hypothetical protein [Flavobacterium alvei]POY41089.1 hypothetical protein C3L50_00750 [Flavobacterium alvei]HQF47807.1 hypothetical protein [Flavobacterium alvei]HQK39400.1 hypothetical protein [Flavobacterium alvei]
MKNTLYFLLIITFFSMTFMSCENGDENYETYNIATPVTMSLSELRSSVKILPPQKTAKSGKIYVYDNFIFINDQENGIHIIDNTIPTAPKKISFLKILGNTDIAVKDQMLFADSFTDLVVFDISDIRNIVEKKRLNNVFPQHIIYPTIDNNLPLLYDYPNYNADKIIVGWSIKKEKRKPQNIDYLSSSGGIMFNAASSESTTGQGGSLARFMIVEDYLYAVDNQKINIFNIQNLSVPTKVKEQNVGWGIETIFNKNDYLYIGSTNGMYIYDIKSLENPVFASRIAHINACDPVVVDEKYAYVTLRSGNFCGGTNNVLEIIDITNKVNPVKTASFVLENPYGLGIKDQMLFICDGSAGLKVFNKTDVFNLQLTNQFKNINPFDVIPLDDKLLLVGQNTLFQYKYKQNDIELISTFMLE